MNRLRKSCQICTQNGYAVGRIILLCAGAMFIGCSRMDHLINADCDAYALTHEQGGKHRTWSPPFDFTVKSSPESRLFDPTSPEAPCLPDPRPALHMYPIPPDVGRPPVPWTDGTKSKESSSEISFETFSLGDHSANEIQQAGGTMPQLQLPKTIQQIVMTRLLFENDELTIDDDAFDIEPVTIPPSVWDLLPPNCRMRMFEFESVRREFADSHGRQPPRSEQDPSPQLNFDDIVKVALLNNRDYQGQKEQLYRVALRLSLQRYDYELKFTPSGNGSGLFFDTRNSRTGTAIPPGLTPGAFSRLRVPTQAQMQALLTTGTNMVTTFANEVLLTFNGPDGFAADVSSELLFELTHSVFQNDVRFEDLTQAERDVVYAARNFARFRRTFYVSLADQYYALLRTFRQVEIDAQNYLSLVRVYSQRNVELEEGQISRLQIDQVEQNALNGRSRLITTCNDLENLFDRLKIITGLPTETRFNIELGELRTLTLQDEMLVALELVRRSSERLRADQQRDAFDDVNALNQAAEIVARIREVMVLNEEQQSRDAETEAIQELDIQQSQLRVVELRILADRVLTEFIIARDKTETAPFRVAELSSEYTQLVLELLSEEIAFARLLGAESARVSDIQNDRSRLESASEEVGQLAESVLSDVQVNRMEELRRHAVALAGAAKGVAENAWRYSTGLARIHGVAMDGSVEELVNDPLLLSQKLLDQSDSKLPVLDVDMDEAALAALWRRFDLMNIRGMLADEWRGIKLAADDLRSVLNLRAQQRLFTRNESGHVADFDFDETRTDLAVTIDTPLNRRQQRNTYREQILNYHLARRNQMASEDNIKRDVRTDLRTLRVARQQHDLSVASAALASERVINTELQLRLGVGGVQARDYLEAQTAYANSLSSVANRRFDHILGRIKLFADMEQLPLDSEGQWRRLDDQNWQPDLELLLEDQPNYGRLPADLDYSDEVRRGFGR